MSDVKPWLPFDYSRCVGAKEFLQCDNCLRKLAPGHQHYQSFFTVPPIENMMCKYYIPFKEIK